MSCTHTPTDRKELGPNMSIIQVVTMWKLGTNYLKATINCGYKI